jgi:hypothetical protein
MTKRRHVDDGNIDVLSIFEPVCRANNVLKRYSRRFLNETGVAPTGRKLIFEIEPQIDPYNFYESTLGFDLKILKLDGTNIDAQNLVSTIQAPGFALIKDIDVYANHKKIVTHQNHDYSSYFENLVNFNEDAYKSWLQGGLWAKVCVFLCYCQILQFVHNSVKSQKFYFKI